MKIGKYDIPEMRLYPTLVEAAKKIYENFGLNEASDELTVAKLLGHETNKSGAFLYKMSYMRAYGLVEKRGLKATELTKKLTYDPDENERNNALKQILLNIPLWQELYGKFGKTLNTSNLWVELTKIAGLEAPEAQKAQENVRNAYLADFQYLKEEKKPEKGGNDMQGQDNIDTNNANLPQPKVSAGLEEIKFGDNLRIWLPKENTQEAWKKAKRMIDIYLGVDETKS